jgi:hypothetical protein
MCTDSVGSLRSVSLSATTYSVRQDEPAATPEVLQEVQRHQIHR